MRYWIMGLALLLAPGAAQAEWLEASSDHFVVYADDSERDIRKFSEQLERFHEAMEIVTGLEVPAPSPSNRVTVFTVKNQREIERLHGGRNVGGFYIPRAGGSVAFVPRIEVRNGQPDFSMITLLHEYAHHFLMSNSRFPSPRWFGEGGAEFFASAKFTAEGGVSVGMPAAHRAWELALARNVKAVELVDSEAAERKPRGNDFGAFYGKSWLLYHYLTFTPERSGQLRGYLRAMTSGKSSLQAAQEVFGDLNQLERELERYAGQRTMLSLQFQPGQLEIAPMTVRRISAGEAAMMPVRIRSDRGVTREQAIDLLVEARAVAAQHPGDAAVLSALAEAEYDAGNDAEAIAAADAALALDPSQVNAYVQKGYALFRRASEAEDRTAAYREAVKPFIALNKIENDHPLPLVYYYRSFAERGAQPPEQAIHGLERASELAPFDLGLRLNLAVHQIVAGELDAARANLVPVAYNPHGDGMANAARLVIERIDAGGEPEAPELLALLSGRPVEAVAAGDAGAEGDAGAGAEAGAEGEAE
jgi:tetratricopeptide (TPR) repeat protein